MNVEIYIVMVQWGKGMFHLRQTTSSLTEAGKTAKQIQTQRKHHKGSNKPTAYIFQKLSTYGEPE